MKSWQKGILFWGLLFLSLSVLAQGFFRKVSSSGQERKELESVEKLVKEGRIEDAVKGFEDFIKKYSESKFLGDACLGLGRIYFEKQNYEGAILNLSKAVGLLGGREDKLEASWFLGKSYFQIGNYGDAVKALSGLFDLTRDSERQAEISLILFQSYLGLEKYPEGIFWMGKCYSLVGSKEKEEIISLVDELIPGMSESEVAQCFRVDGPGEVQGRLGYWLGRYYFDENRFEDARAVLEDLVGRYSGSSYSDDAKELLKKLERYTQVISGRIGLLLPLSGSYQQFGERALKGALLAGGIFGDKAGNKLEIVVKDAESSPEKAVEAVKSMILDEHIIALVGPLISSNALAVAEVCERFGAPMVALSPTEELSGKGYYIFRNCLSKKAQVRFLLDWAMGEKKLSRFAVLYPNDKYGIEFAQLFNAEVITRGGELVKSVYYHPDDTDFTGIIEEELLVNPPGGVKAIKKEKSKGLVDFQALFIPDSWDKIDLIVPQLSYYEIKVQLLGGSGWHSKKIFEYCRPHCSALDSAVFVDLYAPELGEESFEVYRFFYQQAYQEEPTLIDAQAYEAVRLLGELIAKHKINNRKQLAEELYKTNNWSGALGNLMVDSSGEFQHRLHIFQIERGEFRVIR